MDLDRLDAERGGPMRVVAGESIVVLPAAADLPWRAVAASGVSAHQFALTVWPADAKLPAWKLDAAQAAWCKHNGLPEPQQLRRLISMMEKYGEGIEYDLQAKLGVSAKQLFQERRWRELLGFIDQLPSNTHKNRLMMADEEYMLQVLRYQEDHPDQAKAGPSMSDWSQEASLFAKAIDAINRVAMIVNAANGGKKMNVQPEPRPHTEMDRLRYKLQEARHQEMVNLLTPNRG